MKFHSNSLNSIALLSRTQQFLSEWTSKQQFTLCFVAGDAILITAPEVDEFIDWDDVIQEDVIYDDVPEILAIEVRSEMHNNCAMKENVAIHVGNTQDRLMSSILSEPRNECDADGACFESLREKLLRDVPTSSIYRWFFFSWLSGSRFWGSGRHGWWMR